MDFWWLCSLFHCINTMLQLLVRPTLYGGYCCIKYCLLMRIVSRYFLQVAWEFCSMWSQFKSQRHGNCRNRIVGMTLHGSRNCLRCWISEFLSNSNCTSNYIWITPHFLPLTLHCIGWQGGPGMITKTIQVKYKFSCACTSHCNWCETVAYEIIATIHHLSYPSLLILIQILHQIQ